MVPIKDHVERVVKLYLKHAAQRTRASTFKETSRIMSKEALPHWRGRRLSEITKADVRALIERCAKRTKKGVGGNRLLASLKTWLGWCVEQDILTVSPAAAIRPPAPETARERVLFCRFRARGRPGRLPGPWRVWRRAPAFGAYRRASK
jgi:site-specific recombinase XerC